MAHDWDCDCYACRLNDAPKVFVVVERCGDGYHADDSELHMVYFDEPTARRHAAQHQDYEVVEVPIGPHMIAPE